MNEFDPDRDDPRTKVIQIDTNKIYMKRTDPYGFIELSLDKGSLPENLKHARYTTWEHAQAAVDQYMKARDKVALEEAPPKPVIPHLERKKVSS